MSYKFERLEVWQMAMDYGDITCDLAECLPAFEDFNLKSQLRRASTSTSLNIAEGSTTQTDAEQARFLGLAIGSLIETVSCQHSVYRRRYLEDLQTLREAYQFSRQLFMKLQSFRAALKKGRTLREEEEEYTFQTATPFPDYPNR